MMIEDPRENEMGESSMDYSHKNKKHGKEDSRFKGTRILKKGL